MLYFEPDQNVPEQMQEILDDEGNVEGHAEEGARHHVGQCEGSAAGRMQREASPASDSPRGSGSAPAHNLTAEDSPRPMNRCRPATAVTRNSDFLLSLSL